MVCPKCYALVPEGVFFCPKCGYNLSLNNTPKPAPNNTDNDANTDNAKRTGKFLFAIEQKSHWWGGGRIKVHIDGKFVKTLMPGRYFSSILDNGKHRLYLALGKPGTRLHETRSLEFTGDDNEITFFLDIPKSSAIYNADAWIINKVKETQPGTLHKMEDLKL